MSTEKKIQVLEELLTRGKKETLDFLKAQREIQRVNEEIQDLTFSLCDEDLTAEDVKERDDFWVKLMTLSSERKLHFASRNVSQDLLNLSAEEFAVLMDLTK